MAKLKKKNRLLFTSSLFIISGFVIFMALDQDKSLDFALPLDVTQDQIDACIAQGAGINICNPNIWVSWKVQTDVVDSDGKVIAVEHSPFFAGNPITTFDLTDEPSGKTLSGFIVKPEVKIATSAQEIFSDPFGLFTPFDASVNVDSADLLIKVYSQNNNGDLIETWNGNLKTKDLKFTKPDAQILGEQTINAVDILKFLPEGKYNSWQRIVVGGTLLVHWDGFPSVKYAITSEIEEVFNNGKLVEVKNPIINFRQIIVDKGTPATEQQPDGSCAEGQILHNGICVTQGTTPNTTGVNDITPSNNSISNFITCSISNPDKSCLTSLEFAPFYIIGLVVVAVAFGLKKQSREPIYGVQ